MSETVWLQVTTGRGPGECRWVAARVIETITCEAAKIGLSVRIEEAEETPEGLSSAVVSVAGRESSAFVDSWNGSIQWIGTSPFRPHHKRRNWYVGIQTLKPPTRAIGPLDPRELTIETTKAGGPGGQHVNTTDSAVRVIHKPTGLVVLARGERSQHRNKAAAIARLQALLEDRSHQDAAKARTNSWQHHNLLERGNPIRRFKGKKFVPAD
ncbi:peptide chain release factor H [Magnetospira sp. QH-2]|uniref:peptide chain release factor H n=1 Tax=Magnetospira sp. (strain QH-2) TaxID=1288970 RepID=UPI0003E81ACA|nr:peptide chain release factor H [Magnetospira sp. QH-2]CCQ75254.1 putative peptide chain release factor H [Magnetospira sp. QH-2]